MGIIERKKNLGSAAKNRDGRMIVNKHIFFLPYTFWFASFISFGRVRPRKSIVVTWPKIYGLSGNLKHFFLGLIFRNADFLFIMLGQH